MKSIFNTLLLYHVLEISISSTIYGYTGQSYSNSDSEQSDYEVQVMRYATPEVVLMPYPVPVVVLLKNASTTTTNTTTVSEKTSTSTTTTEPTTIQKENFESWVTEPPIRTSKRALHLRFDSTNARGGKRFNVMTMEPYRRLYDHVPKSNIKSLPKYALVKIPDILSNMIHQLKEERTALLEEKQKLLAANKNNYDVSK